MSATHAIRRLALTAAGAAVACAGFLAVTPGASANGLGHPQLPLTPNGSGDPTTGPSFAPSRINCMDPNNTINCPGPNLDSPLAPGTAEPGSPFRD